MKKREDLKASLTVEAALAFPVFFLAVMALCCLFLFMETRIAIGEAMLETARSISAYGELVCDAEGKLEEKGAAAELAGDILEGTAISLMIKENLKGHPVVGNTVEGGLSGISLEGSDFCTEDECLHLVCSYRFRSPVAGFGLSGIKGRQELVYRYFTGTHADSLLEEAEEETEEAEEETVYKTDTGTVYHVKLTCPSLKLTIRPATPSEIPGLRNEYGAKYYPCEKCASGAEPETVYITTDGDRYHYKLNCSGLKRTIIEIKRSEIGDLRPCKRCGDKGD